MAQGGDERRNATLSSWVTTSVTIATRTGVRMFCFA